jgi:hypothetical protein
MPNPTTARNPAPLLPTRPGPERTTVDYPNVPPVRPRKVPPSHYPVLDIGAPPAPMMSTTLPPPKKKH